MRKYIKGFLYPFYTLLLRFFRHKEYLRREEKKSFVARHWNLNLNIPTKDKEVFINSIIDGKIQPQLKYHKDINNNLILIGQNKSAGLFLTQLLSMSLEYENTQIGLNHSGGSTYLPRLMALKYLNTNTISHTHEKAVPYFIELIDQLCLEPIILTRNIFDSLAGLRDAIIQRNNDEKLPTKSSLQKFLISDNESQMDFVIQSYAQELIQFFSGWEEQININPKKYIHITYEQLVDDEVGLVKKVGNRFNKNITSARIKEVSNKISELGGINKGINHSKGNEVNRGVKILNERQITHIIKIASFHGCANKDFLSI
tara:strand:+ start:1052 stop:1996 length:945 start_codon:yes stop_codon:yes gene_type:complete